MLDQPGIAGAEQADLYGDPPPGTPYGEVDGFLCTPVPIPAERVRLLREDA